MEARPSALTGFLHYQNVVGSLFSFSGLARMRKTDSLSLCADRYTRARLQSQHLASPDAKLAARHFCCSQQDSFFSTFNSAIRLSWPLGRGRRDLSEVDEVTFCPARAQIEPISHTRKKLFGAFFHAKYSWSVYIPCH